MSEFALRVRLYANPTTPGRILVGATPTFTAAMDQPSVLTLAVPQAVAGDLPVPFYAGVEVRGANGAWSAPRNNLYTFHGRGGNWKDPTGLADFTGILWVADRAGGHKIGPTITTDQITWQNASAGGVIADLLTRITGHGITRTFTPAVDSAGTAWPALDYADQTAARFTSVLEVLSALTDAAYCTWWSQGTQLVMRVPGGGVVRTIPIGPGADDVSVEEDTSETGSLFYVVSDQDVPVQTVTRPELGAGPRQAIVTVSGASTVDQALRMAQPVIDAASKSKKQVTVTYQASRLPASPFVDFQIGDDFTVAGGLYRLVGVQASGGDSTSVRLIFGEIFYTLAAKLAQRTSQLTLGTGSTTVGKPIPSQTEPTGDPKPPTGIIIESTAVFGGPAPTAQVTLAWNPVTQTAANSPISVVAYEVWGARGAEQLTFRTTTVIPQATLSGLPTGELWRFAVRAQGSNWRWGAFSAPLEITTAAPPQVTVGLSVPSLSSSFGVVIVAWDGSNTTGPVGAEFNQGWAEFAPASDGPWQRVGAPFNSAGQVAVVRGTAGQDVFVRFVWSDTLGRIADISETSTITVVGVLPEDLDSIPDFFANEAVINSLRVGVLQAGVIEVDMLSPNVGSQIDISANDGVNIITGRLDGLEAAGQYYRFGPDGAIIGREDDPTTFNFRNDGASFDVNGVPVTTWGASGMDVPALSSDVALLGNHRFEKSGDSTLIRWAGEDGGA